MNFYSKYQENNAGEEGLMISYAMANIELLDNQGNKLQLAEGKKASLKFPILPALQPTATNTMPIWSFDEEIGIWKEEGTGTRVGNMYEAEVSHFSPWNMDIYTNSVLINQTLACGNKVLKNALLKMVRRSDKSASGFIYTNNFGTYQTVMPANTIVDIFLVQSYGPKYCNTLLGTITTGNDNSTLAQMNTCPPVISVIGSVVDCNNTPVTKGYAMGSIGDFHTLGAILDENGKFELTTYFCASSNQLNVTAWDISNFSYNDDLKLPLENKTINLSTPIKICASQSSLNNTAYFLGSDNYFYGVNSITGAILWETKISNGISSKSPAFENGIFYIANGENKLLAINALDGTIIWTKALQVISETPLAYNGVLYVGTQSGKVYALNAVSGNEIWNYDTDGVGGNSVSLYSSPTIHNGVLYIGTSTTKIIGLDINSEQPVWNFLLDKDAVYSNPAIADGKVFLTTFGIKSILYAVKVQDATEAWRVNVNSYMSNPATDSKNVFLHTDNFLKAYSLADGSLSWTYTIGGAYMGSSITTSPLVDGGKVYFGGRDGKMKCVDATTGNLIWDYSVSEGVVSGSPVVADGLLYFTGTHFDNKVYALKATDGKVVWTIPIVDGGSGSAMVVIDQNGIAHFSSMSGAVQ